MIETLAKVLPDLAKIGCAGVGVAIFLLLFILLYRGKPVDAASAKLYNRFLTWGVSFAVFCGLLGFASALFPPPSDVAKPRVPGQLVVNFAPDFKTDQLPAPQIKLPDGTVVQPDQAFVTPDDPHGMININVGAAINQIRALKTAATELSANNATLIEQQKKLLAALPQSTTPPAVTADIKTGAAETTRLQSVVGESLASGDFARAAQASRAMRVPSEGISRAINTMPRATIER